MFDAGQHPYDAISAQRLQMNERFVERVQRAIALGLEGRSRPAGDQALRQMNGEEKICAHCGDVFAPAAVTRFIARSVAARWRTTGAGD
jgi:hypothetical protein